MDYKELLEQRLAEGYTALADLTVGSEEYTEASKALKSLQEAYNDILAKENAKEALQVRRDQNTDMLRATLAELGVKTIFKGIWNGKWMLFEKDGVVKTLGARNILNDNNRW